MRIMIKGGVWKNTEDEILKAAVMKYGLNQWSRISSLLVRKTAKQCKARWFEWLDPSIKKTEWTREEDEKLLHLAKLMPCQWRTIAPIVGRTPAQCLERYEKLLDMAVSKDERYEAADDPRRLRPGEIDPNPESKPARPDPVDMDEDEKEMLSEARARLANTRGKKAKRKAREKQLEEARRLASLQKKRELKAAGIEMRGRDKGRRTIDYNTEVAFERKAAAGFFDTADEDARTRMMSQEFRPVTVEELEGRRRKDIEEALIKHDIKRQKIVENHDTPMAVAKALEMNEAAMNKRRGKMMLPAPQVSDVELEQIQRMAGGGMDPDAMYGAGGEATRGLLGEYGRAAPTPMRTPRTAATGDRIMLEAQNLARLTNMGTVLEGGENPDLHPMDFSGVTPRQHVAATPNPLHGSATPSVRGGSGPSGHMSGSRTLAIAGVSATPSLAGTPLRSNGSGPFLPGATPMRTPLRDELGLNDMDSMVSAHSLREEKVRQKTMRDELMDKLQGLPAPENQYSIAVPDMDMLEDEDGEQFEEDAADIKARRIREEEARRQAEEKKKSKALQRHLPRPLTLEQLPGARPAAELAKLAPRERAEELVQAEMAALLTHDALKYPIKDRADKKKDKSSRAASGPVPALEQFEVAELEAAAKLLDNEVRFLVRGMGHERTSAEEYHEQWAKVQRDLIFVPSKGRYERAATAPEAEKLEAIKADFEGARGEMEREAKKAAKVEQKVNILLGGLQRRDGELRTRSEELWAQIRDTNQDLTCFKALRERELRAAPERLEALGLLLERQRTREAALQERYKGLSRRRDELREALGQAVH